MRAFIDGYVNVINLIGHGINKRTRMVVYTGLGWKRLNQILNELEDKGYIKRVEVVSSGVNPMSFILTDKGVKFYRVINEYHDILAKNINTFTMIFG